MEKLNDEELTEVLRKRNLYKEEAAKIAIQEAQKRGLIQSEKDLLAPKFRPEPLKARFIPDINNPKSRNKIRKSIGRSFVIAGILPVIRGIVKINTGIIPEGLMVLAFGLAWIGVSAWMIRQFTSTAVKILFVLTGVSLFYIIQLLISNPVFVFLDWFIAAMLYLLIAYGLIFVLRLKR